MKIAGLEVKQLSPFKWEIPQDESRGMRVPGIIFIDQTMLEQAIKDRAAEQVINVATLPGIVCASLAMPDIHWGYGFPIGGVAAMDVEEGVISPGGVGFDIACGIRLLRTNLSKEDVDKVKPELMQELNRNVPKGVGKSGRVKVDRSEFNKAITMGARWGIGRGYGWEEDIEFLERRGCLAGADPDAVSQHAYERGHDQIGTLGSGNHFVEIQVVEEIYDEEAARACGLSLGQITVMIHSGSRGFGHQICTDYLKVMERVTARMGYQLPDRQLACAPIKSEEGVKYASGLACGVNYAVLNRQLLTHWVRGSFERVLRASARKLGINIVYDNSHNLVLFEEHQINGIKKELCVHRKGATRAFGPGHPDLPENYKSIGQPIVVPGDMGTCSFLLLGTEQAMKESFGSTCHGAGRMMSRSEAKRRIRGTELKNALEARGISVMADSMPGLAEEAPDAYKDVSQVVEICVGARISRKVAKMVPIGVLKG